MTHSLADHPIPVAQPKIDCHVHVFDPVRFPYAPDTFYRPVGHEVATTNALGHVMAAHGVQRALIVGPNSGYGFDNRCLLDALRQGAGSQAQPRCLSGQARSRKIFGAETYQGSQDDHSR